MVNAGLAVVVKIHFFWACLGLGNTGSQASGEMLVHIPELNGVCRFSSISTENPSFYTRFVAVIVGMFCSLFMCGLRSPEPVDGHRMTRSKAAPFHLHWEKIINVLTVWVESATPILHPGQTDNVVTFWFPVIYRFPIRQKFSFFFLLIKWNVLLFVIGKK